MPATVRIVYDGPFDAVDVPSLGLYAVERGKPVEVGTSIAEQALTHPDWHEAPASTKSTAKEA